MLWNFAPVPVPVGGQREVALLVGGGERGFHRIGVVAGDAVVERLGVGALLDEHLAVLHRRDVEEADAVLGVQRARPVGPAVADGVALLGGLAVGEHVRPPQGVDDEEPEHQTCGDEEFTEDADGGRDGMAAALPRGGERTRRSARGPRSSLS